MKIIKSILFFAILIGFINDLHAADKVSNLFTQYLQKVHKIEEPPQNQTYLIIDLVGCPPCIREYVPATKELCKNMPENLTAIFIGGVKNPPDWFADFSNNPHVYYDGIGAYRRINITSGESGVVIVQDGKIVKKIIIKMDNHKEIIGGLKEINDGESK